VGYAFFLRVFSTLYFQYIILKQVIPPHFPQLYLHAHEQHRRDRVVFAY
jgi:hypothetical protein